MTVNVRNCIVTVGALIGLLIIAAAQPAEAQAKDNTVRVGYIHSALISTPLLVGQSKATFATFGVNVELVRFTDGVSMSQALAGGSIDVGNAGPALVSNFSSRGNGIVVGPSYIEYDTNQIWAAPNAGIKNVKDLAGKQVALPRGTTSEMLLIAALNKNAVARDAVEIVNTAPAGAATALVSNAVSAAGLWSPFTRQISERAKGAVLVTSLKDYYPELTIIGGLVARPEFFKSSPDLLKKFVAGFLKANDIVLAQPLLLDEVWKEAFMRELTLVDFRLDRETGRYPSADEWAEMARSGKIAESINSTQDLLITMGALNKKRDAVEFFAKDFFLSAYDLYRKSK